MGTRSYLVLATVAASVLLAACATNPEAEARRQAVEDEIAAILAEPLDPEVYGESKRCLSDRESRNFYALDDQRVVFEGYRDKLWLNTLPYRCPDLRWGTALRVRSISWTRICEMDRFVVGDWFDWPWYRRWPWRWTSDFGTGMTCTLGKFQPVTEQQVDAIERVLESR